MIIHTELPEGEPLFQSDEEYQRFRDSFYESVKDDLEKYRIARMKSERDALFRIVD